MHVNQLRPGIRAIVTEIVGTPADEQRLREHGFAEGLEVEVLHRAAFGRDPIAIRAGNACIAMRAALASCIRVDSDAVAADLTAAE